MNNLPDIYKGLYIKQRDDWNLDICKPNGFVLKTVSDLLEAADFIKDFVVQ